MSNIETPDDLFVRIKQGKIVEKGVRRLHIVNRGHPLHWYTRVIEVAPPDVPAFHHLVSDVVLQPDGTVVQTHEVVEDDLASVLYSLSVADESSQDPMGMSRVPKAITDIDQDTVQYVYKRMGEYFREKMNAFAKERQYDSIDSLLSYSDSTVPQFAAEAARGKLVRDQVWGTLLPYFQEVVAGTKPVPITVAEVDALVPPFTWEDVPAEG